MYRGDDILKIYDQDLNNIGRATREEVHTQGLLHQVAHVWMFQPTEDDTYIISNKIVCGFVSDISNKSILLL